MIWVSITASSGNFDKLGMLGVTVKSIDMGDIPVTTVEDMDGLGGTFKPTLTTMGVTYANSFSDRSLLRCNWENCL